MREMEFSRIIKEIVVPFLLFVIFTLYMLHEAVCAIKEIKRFKREGCAVRAKVMGYNVTKCYNGEFSYNSYNVKVECRSPEDDNERAFFLSTTDRRAKRYKNLKETEGFFLSQKDGKPVLREELRSIKRVRFTALFGGIFCALFCALIIVGVIYGLFSKA